MGGLPSAMQNEWDLPRVKASIGFEDDYQYYKTNDQDTEFFDVKFFPYQDQTEPPVFAAVSKKHIVIYRLNNEANPPYELIQLIRDNDEQAVNCSCTWSKDPVTDTAWLCVAGADAKIKVYDVVNGTLVKTLVGHGSEVNDLATSPIDPLLIASASDDTTVRLWSLDPADEEQPCVCIFGGEGHSSGLLTIAFHSCGRYVLSAGHDNCVCLWTLPDLTTRPRDKHPAPPVIVHYPHFYTSEVHSGIVDCVAFFGDLILSRACHENVIVLWRIEGFSSQDPPPPADQAPTTSDTERLTRSAFAPATATTSPPQYKRLLMFSTPDSGHQFYMRFRLFHDKEKHPVLAFGNAHSVIFFWDLARLTAYHTFKRSLLNGELDGTMQRPSWLTINKGKPKGGDAVSKLKDAEDKGSVTSEQTGSMDPEVPSYPPEVIQAWDFQYDMTHVEVPVQYHAKATIHVTDFIGRQVAWSPQGDWCVVVGSKNLAILLQRWQKKEEKHSKKPGSHSAGY